tara:strand:+ start:597 stop:920 length:324 start_codon:yes stop_codon:yes gene_type:complete
MNKADVIKICGEYPENFIEEDIGSNPNYVFINDPNFNEVTVYDADGNIAVVNSFQECEHYVTGGWDKNQLALQETTYQYGLTLIIIGILLFKPLVKKINFYDNIFKK